MVTSADAPSDRRPHSSGGILLCFSPRRPRRLRPSSSLKGAQSPAIFPSHSRRASSSAAVAEPSSPKVSCIGQVRVKTARRRRKKKLPPSSPASELRSRSRGGRDPGLRPAGESQSWVHLPLGGLCDGLRAFGSDFNCFRPCLGKDPADGSWCCSCSCACGGKGRRRKRARMCSCRAAFAGCWVMELGEGAAAGDDEEAAAEDEEGNVVVVMREKMRSSRRGMMELELLADELEKGKLNIPAEETVASDCVPPKNALLLMRCRSDPAKMASLTTRFIEPEAIAKLELEELGEIRREQAVVERGGVNAGEITEAVDGVAKDQSSLPPLPRKFIGEEEGKENKDVIREAKNGEVVEKEGIEKDERRKSFRKDGSGAGRRSTSWREGRRSSFSTEGEARRSSFEKEGRRRWSFSSEKDAKKGEGERHARREEGGKATEVKAVAAVVGEGEKKAELPDCLLLMMYEPKLSMEVSKETWVCPADFVRWQPHRRRQQRGRQPNGDVDGVKNQATSNSVPKPEKKQETDSTDATQVTDSTDATLPSPPPVVVPSSPQLESRRPASTGNIAFESATSGPFVLMRCKSEPMRSSASDQLSLDGCFWRSRHQPVGTAGNGV